MTEEEIKEILDKLKYIVDFPIIEHDTSFNSDNVEESVCLLISNECQLLLDYITNLQQENESNINRIHELEQEIDSEYIQKEYYKSRYEKLKNFITNLISKLNHCELNGTKKLDIVSDYIKQEYEKELKENDNNE